jgi:hypothetical protein
MSSVYESLTRSARRQEQKACDTWGWNIDYDFMQGYKKGVYDTLQKLSVELTSSGSDIDLGTYRMLTRPKRGPFVIS